MSMTYEEASQLTIGDQIELDRNGQRFTIHSIPPHPAKKLVLILDGEDGVKTYIDETRLHLVSRAGTNWKPAAVEPQLPSVDTMVKALRETVEDATVDLTEPEEGPSTDAEPAREDTPREEKKPRGRSGRNKKG